MTGRALHPANIVSGHRRIPLPGSQRGFTLVELIVVIIIIGILSAVGAVRFFDRRGFDANAFAEQTRAMLRFGQKLAIGQNRLVYAQLNGNTIALCFASASPCPAGSYVPAVGGNGGSGACSPSNLYCAAPLGTITYAITPTNASTLCFTRLGQPGLPAGTDCNTAGFTGATVNITGDGNTTAVNIAAETGYVF